MKNLNIINILSAFSKDEIKLFDKFVRSPFFNNQSTLIRMFDALRKYYPDFNSNGLSREKIFGCVAPGQKYDDVLFRKYASNLAKLAEEFLVIRGNDSDSEGKARVLLQEYYERRLNKMYEKTLKKIDKQYVAQAGIGGHQFLNRHMLEELKIDFEIMNGHQPRNTRLLIDSQYYIFNYFIMLTINNISELANITPPPRIPEKENLITAFAKNFSFGKFISGLTALPEEQLFTLKMNYLDLSILLKPKEFRYYFEMKELLKKYSGMLSTHAFYMYIVKLNNFCIHRINEGEKCFEKEIIENYDYALHSEKYLEKIKQNFSFMEFRNALIFSLEQQMISWAEWFVKSFIGQVRTEKKNAIQEYADAFIAFEQKDFQKSFSHVSKIEFFHPLMRYDINTLLTKLYYEMNYFDACYSLMDSFRHLLIQSEVITENARIQLLNYLKMYKQLLEAKQKTKKHIAPFIKKEILNEKMLKSRRWLLEKTDEL